MGDYISRKAVLDLAKQGKLVGNRSYKSVCDFINKIPAADVRPVKKGRWIKDSDGLDICSECEEVALQRVFIKLPEKIVDLQMRRSNFCPNCGADMRPRKEVK